MSDGGDYIEQAKAVLGTEIDELQRLSGRIGQGFVRAVEVLQECLDRQGKIIIIGVGKSENIATKVCATFNSTGAPAVVLSCQNALHGDLGIVTEGDAVLALSYSGETSELLSLLPHIKRRIGCLISMTGQPDSPLATDSDIVLDVGVTAEACPLNLAPTSSTTNMLALGDALAMVLLQARGFQAEDFAELHPGGSLGRQLLTRVKDIMRHGDRLALVAPADTVAIALAAMKECKAGAVVAINADGGLCGIFTHGDFVRAYQENCDIAGDQILNHMTENPVAIQGDKLATEAVRTFEKHLIDEIVVVDSTNKVIGLVDVQDLSRTRMF
ncbi:MAG: KpsF/GutQ family sugar-phosphate isomerase [Planctomycetaceae bacterium]|nr:KpsF/GutQ family sugar-phosphate isomerase [Planctomycetaceae bacterium]|tara:strand:+ start:1358 stop:2341 length:984 start_codon:yes stop_codon:yes gene_type:complete